MLCAGGCSEVASRAPLDVHPRKGHFPGQVGPRGTSRSVVRTVSTFCQNFSEICTVGSCLLRGVAGMVLSGVYYA